MSSLILLLRSLLSQFDYSVLSFWHSVAEYASSILTPLSVSAEFFFEHGMIFYVTGILLMLNSKTRKCGICVIGAVITASGFIMIMKEPIGRIRPYMANEVLAQWWNYVGARAQSDYCFPSGHTTTCMAGISGIVFVTGKKKHALLYLIVVLVGCSRNYLMVHYPSDIIAGVALGLISASLSYLITLMIYMFLDAYKETPFCKFVLEWNLIPEIK